MPEITDSSHIIGADWSEGILTVRFKNGMAGEFYDVSFAKYQEFLAAPSKGKFLNANLKNVHEYARI